MIRNARKSTRVCKEYANNDAEIIPKLYRIRKLKISPNIKTDDSVHVARRHTLQVRMNRPMRAQTC